LKNLAELQAECQSLGINVSSSGRASKEPYIAALQRYHWERQHPGKAFPRQIMPMLLEGWSDLDERQAQELDNDHHSWIVQEKYDGVRTLFHVQPDGVRITGRCTSEVTYRLTEHQDNLPHLLHGLEGFEGTILDGELVCPVAQVNTRSTITTSPLQAAVAVLAASPEKANHIQRSNEAHLRLHVFDILELRGEDVTGLPLIQRLQYLGEAIEGIQNPHIEVVPSFVVNKKAIHDNIVLAGGEGTVWKHAGSLYEPGKRVSHWIKRKRGLEVEAFVTGFKLGSPERGHSHLVGAIEFSIQEHNGSVRPIAWVSGWSDQERVAMTWKEPNGRPTLNPTYLGRAAVVVGQDEAGKSRRIRHARLKHWVA
jgi:ATP-dependent DNA ligase